MRVATICATLATLSLTSGCVGNQKDSPTPQATQQEVSATAQSTSDSSSTPSSTPSPTRKELPQGGTTIFPDYRLVGFCGQPNAKGQGPLHSNLDQVMERLDGVIAEYNAAADADLKRRQEFNQLIEPTGDSSPAATANSATSPPTPRSTAKAAQKTAVPVPPQATKTLPIVELIITTVHGVPGADGMFRSRGSDETVQRYLELTRRNKGLLLLNIQPGRADFIDEVKHLEKWLKEPDVGLALDPEWAVDPGQIPGKVFGNTNADEINEVSKFVSDIVQDNTLPEKVIVFHQLHANIVKNQDQVQEYPGIVTIKSVDGIGSPGQKVATYNRLVKDLPDSVHTGFKLFYEEDVKTGKVLMTPQEVLALDPQPKYVMYE